MIFSHTPVLLEEVIQGLNIKDDGIYLDLTLGGGGHSEAICQNLKDGIFIGNDRDPEAIDAARNRLKTFSCRQYYIEDVYLNIEKNIKDLGIDKVDGIVMDLGVSSYQLDNPMRGFSYMQDGPLDMRMGNSDISAYDVVNGYQESELARIIKDYGEERWAARIAKFIVEARKIQEINTTYQLVDIIKKAVPKAARRDGPHPAKRTFQAIRIEVNDELAGLRDSVNSAIEILDEGGRLAVITFHSLEDRIVKNVIKERLNPCTCPKDLPRCVCMKLPDIRKITRKPIIPSREELEMNPRARSSKLRIVEKI